MDSNVLMVHYLNVAIKSIFNYYFLALPATGQARLAYVITRRPSVVFVHAQFTKIAATPIGLIGF